MVHYSGHSLNSEIIVCNSVVWLIGFVTDGLNNKLSVCYSGHGCMLLVPEEAYNSSGC